MGQQLKAYSGILLFGISVPAVRRELGSLMGVADFQASMYDHSTDTLSKATYQENAD